MPSGAGEYTEMSGNPLAGSASSRARESTSGRAMVYSNQGRERAMARDMSLASLDRVSIPGPGHYETNVSSCVSTEATRKLKNDA